MKRYKGLLIILILFIISACSPFYISNEEKQTWRSDIVFNTEVVVTSGFFAGQKGRVLSQTWYYIRESGRYVPGFNVKLYNSEEPVGFNQFNLEIVLDKPAANALIEQYSKLPTNTCIEKCIKDDLLVGQVCGCIEACPKVQNKKTSVKNFEKIVSGK